MIGESRRAMELQKGDIFYTAGFEKEVFEVLDISDGIENLKNLYLRSLNKNDKFNVSIHYSAIIYIVENYDLKNYSLEWLWKRRTL